MSKKNDRGTQEGDTWGRKHWELQYTGSRGDGGEEKNIGSELNIEFNVGGGSSWFGGSNIHHRASLSVYSEGEEGNDDSISEDVSLTKSGDTSINME